MRIGDIVATIVLVFLVYLYRRHGNKIAGSNIYKLIAFGFVGFFVGILLNILALATGLDLLVNLQPLVATLVLPVIGMVAGLFVAKLG